MSNQSSLISYLAQLTISPLVQKRLVRKPYLLLGQLLFAEQRLFELSMLLGYRYRNRLDIFVQLFSTPGNEASVINFLETIAKDNVDNLSKEPAILLDVFYTPELKRLGIDIGDGRSLEGMRPEVILKEFQSISVRKVPADGVWQSVTMASTAGIAFGSMYPSLTEKLWINTYGKPANPERWKLARETGLNIPEVPDEPISIRDGQDNVMPMFERFVHDFRPEMLSVLL